MNQNLKELMKIDIKDVGEVLQKLYESEISMHIKSEWDNGIDAGIGTEYSGINWITKNYNTNITEVVAELAEAVAEKYPDSDFANWYSNEIKNPA
jgi:hypothetical protein